MPLKPSRRELHSALGMLGVTGVLPGWLTGCASRLDGPVVIVGAGAAGLTAGFLLDQAGVPFTVLEASGQRGGRLRKLDGFIDVPLDLGGEWVHTRASVLNELSQTRDAADRTTEYRPMTASYWDGSRLHEADDIARAWRGEQRFIDTTWFDFFEDLLAPPVLPHVRLNTPVAAIAYDRQGALVTTADGEEIDAAKVLFTAPLQVLMDGDVAFDPPLPARKTRVFDRVVMPPGLKVFLEFAERFYPDLVGFDDPPFAHVEYERAYYNVSLDKPTARHVLGLYAVGTPALPYLDHDDDEARLDHILAELDQMFSGAASRHYLQHHTQDWAAEPFVRGTFSMFDDWRDVRPLGEPLERTVYFAGEAYNLRDNWGFAHLAGRAAYDAVDAMLG